MADSLPPGTGRNFGYRSTAHQPPLGASLGRVIGAGVALFVGAVGVVVTLVFAAALAVFTVVASLLLAVVGITWRLGRRPAPAGAPVILDARKVGHAWVAYGWDEPRS